MKAKTLKKGLGIALSMAMTMSLFGCGSGDSAKEQASDTSETTEVAENTDSKDSDTDKGGKDMTFWIFLDPKSTEDPRSVVLSNIVKEYNETNQYGNTVTVESFNYSVFESQAIQAAAAGKGPDIINCFSDQLKQHIDAGTVQPMTDYAKDFITEMGDYIYTSDKLTQSDGEIYSLPWESRVTAMWYRSDLYDSAPQSWDDLLAQSSKASTDTSLGFALGLSEDGNGTALEKEGAGYVVASLGVDSGYVPYTSYSAKTSYMEKNPEIIQKFTNALQKGMEYVQSHTPEEIAEVIAPQFAETDLDTVTAIVKRYYDQDTWKSNLIFEKESFELLEDILEDSGELSERVSYENLVTTKYAQEAAEK